MRAAPQLSEAVRVTETSWEENPEESSGTTEIESGRCKHKLRMVSRPQNPGKDKEGPSPESLEGGMALSGANTSLTLGS